MASVQIVKNIFAFCTNFTLVAKHERLRVIL